jgi:D-alanine-D-alanine ligase
MSRRVAVVYNHAGIDEYESLKDIDPATLDFKPEYSIHVSTAQEEYDSVAKALAQEGFDVTALNVKDDLKSLRKLLEGRPPDVIFNLVEYFKESSLLEAAVAGLYELYGVPYTGAPPFALGLCVRKGLTKQVLLANGVPTPRFKLLHEPLFPKRHGLRYPLIVKPAREDASAGVNRGSVVFDFEALQGRLMTLAADFKPPYLVEEFVEGSELHVSVLGNDPPVVLPIIEFDFSELPDDYPKIISYDAKWNPLEEVYHRVHSVCPARIARRTKKAVEDICLKAYRITGCRDYARIDLRLDKKGRPFLLEVNPNPDLTEGVSFMESAEASGLTFSRTLRMIVEYALGRAPER